jgi:hypothetical protein
MTLMSENIMPKRGGKMIIANPIYDVTFKRLLENDRTAKFLIGTILDCKVVSLTPAVIERTKYDKDTGTGKRN